MASNIGPADDPVGTMMSITTGGKGIDAVCKTYQEGSDEVKDLLKYETDVILECRYCKNLYRSIANFVAHKRQYCRSLCRSLPIYDVLSKNIEELANKLTNEKDKDKEKKKGQGKGSRVNVVTSVQRKLQTTTFSDDLNRIELYTLPSIARNIPATNFEDGYQAIERMNPFAVLKEALPEDGALLVMPQDDSRVRPTNMTLRKKAKVDFEEKAMTGRELIVLDYIYKDILKSVNPASCQCLFAKCKNIKPFGDILTLAYHLTLQHNRPMTAQDFAKIGKGREGWFTCFLCRTVYRNYDKLLIHVNRDHSVIKQKHIKRRQMMVENSGTKTKKKDTRTSRNGSLSPFPPQSPSDDEKEDAEDDEENELTVKSSNGASPSPKQKLKLKKIKKIPKKVIQVKEESPELLPSQQNESINEIEVEVENIEIEVEVEATNEGKQEDKQKDESLSDSTSSNGRSQSNEPESSLAERRTRRVHRKPRTLAEFALTEDEFNLKHSPPKKKLKLASNCSSNDLDSIALQASEERHLILPKSEIADDDTFLNVEPAITLPTMSPVKARSREALVQSIKKARTVSPVKQSTPKKNKNKDSQESLDLNNWVLPEPVLPRNGTGSGSSTPSKGSGRRKQQLIPTDDASPLLQITEEKVEQERSPSPKRRNLDLDSLNYKFVNDDEQRFFKALRMMDKANYICLECMTPFDGQESGRRHMLSHIRVVRFRCALCDVGAFFLSDMREHLMKKYCPSLRYAPEKYIIPGNGPFIMKQEHADELIQVVHSECPGQYRYTSGRIVSEQKYVPYFPNSEIELRIIGPQAAETITMSTPKKADNIRKSISIMSKPKSPLKSASSSEVPKRPTVWATPHLPNDQIPPKEAIPTPPTIRPIKLFKSTETAKNYVIVTSNSAEKVVSNEQIDSTASQPGPSAVSLRETAVSQ